MGSRVARRVRGGAAAIISLSGLLFSCTNLELSGSTAQAAGTAEPSSHISVDDNFGVADLEQRFEDVAKRVAPAVVAITATDAKLDTLDDALRSDQLTPEKLAALLEPVDRTVGTGFVIDADGYIVTNDHVVASTDNIWVTTDDHHVYPAIVVGTDPRCDLAVIKIPAKHLHTVRFSDALARRGEWTLALGNPYGLAGKGEMALSVGVVSAVDRSLPKLSSKEDRLYSGLIQTTAQINPGNSGGPLFDVRGDVIGINSAVILPQKTTNGIGFAIPISPRIRRVIADLKDGHEVVYGWLGVRVTSPTPLERKDAGLTENIGARIEGVEHDSPASSAGLAVGDVVASFNNMPIVDCDQFVRVVGEAPIESNISATVYRQGKPTTLTVSMTRRAPQISVTRDTQRMRWRGLLVGPIPAHWDFGSEPRPTSGLMVIAIEPHSPFAKSGVAQGSIIATVAGKAVSDVVQLQQIVNDTPADACQIAWAKSGGQVVSVDVKSE